MMKKLISLTLALVLALGLTACGGDSQETTAPLLEPMPTEGPVSVTYYHGDEYGEHLVPEPGLIPSLTPQNLLSILLEQKALPEDTKVLGFSKDGTALKLDLSQSFADALGNAGKEGESILLGTVVNTFLTAYDATSVTLTAEGKTLTTAYYTYDFPLEFFR